MRSACFESGAATELSRVVEALPLRALPEKHVVRIGRADDTIPQNKRMPAVAVWAAEKVVWCEWWWCHSSERKPCGDTQGQRAAVAIQNRQALMWTLEILGEAEPGMLR